MVAVVVVVVVVVVVAVLIAFVIVVVVVIVLVLVLVLVTVPVLVFFNAVGRKIVNGDRTQERKSRSLPGKSRIRKISRGDKSEAVALKSS